MHGKEIEKRNLDTYEERFGIHARNKRIKGVVLLQVGRTIRAELKGLTKLDKEQKEFAFTFVYQSDFEDVGGFEELVT